VDVITSHGFWQPPLPKRSDIAQDGQLLRANRPARDAIQPSVRFLREHQLLRKEAPPRRNKR
jgi:hypothetical protein